MFPSDSEKRRILYDSEKLDIPYFLQIPFYINMIYRYKMHWTLGEVCVLFAQCIVPIGNTDSHTACKLWKKMSLLFI